jgi:hypothetical protein
LRWCGWEWPPLRNLGDLTTKNTKRIMLKEKSK